MRSNPYLSAICASAYIWGVALLFQFTARPNTPDTIADPIAALSTLVFSVAFMAFIFFYRPIVLLLENKRHEAISYFLTTLGTFGMITVAVLVLLRVL